MALTDIEAVRLKASDQPKLYRESWAGDGVTSIIHVEVGSIATSPAPKVWKNNVLQTETTHYIVDYENGLITIVGPAPSLGDDFIIEYSATVYTDEEVDHFLTEASGNTTLAAAFMLYAWSANAAKLA